MTTFDLFVMGGGSGGVRAARIAARHGAKVALAEQDRVGGTCVIRGCVPKKLMVFAARFADQFEDSVGFGWTPGEAHFDWQKLAANLAQEVDRLNAAYIRGLESAGVRLFRDRVVIDAPGQVRLIASDERFQARNILVATGGHPNLAPEIEGSEYAITSEAMFTLKALPISILIVGAGFVAIEFASIMAGLGVATTVLHRGRDILRTFDNDIRAEMHAAMERRGIEIVLADRLARIEKTPSGLLTTTQAGRSIVSDQVLLAIGRSPNTRGIGLEEVGAELDSDGSVRVDEHSRSTAAGIYAVGDVTNRVNLTPVAIREGHALADHLFAGASAVVDHRDVPRAVFAIPEIGTVGLNEEEARDQYDGVDIYQTLFPPMRNQFSGRDENVLLKLIVEAVTDRLLGCHILGPEAAEMIQLVAIAVRMGATKADLDATLALHPTAAEELVTMRAPTKRYRRKAAE